MSFMTIWRVSHRRWSSRQGVIGTRIRHTLGNILRRCRLGAVRRKWPNTVRM